MGNSYLAIGYECNHKCICCPLTTYDRLHCRIELDDLKKRISLIPEAPDNHIVISGGEPMLHPDIFRLLEYLKEKNFSVTILSNSSRCSDKEISRQLAKYDNISVITAIHSCEPRIHDALTGTPGSLMETLEGLDNLVENGVPLTIKHILNAVTLPLLIDTFDYLEKHFPPKVGFQFCTMDFVGRAQKNKDRLFAQRKDITAGLENVLDFLEARMSRQRKISVIEAPYCFADPYYWKFFEGREGRLTTYIAPNTDEMTIAYDIGSECNTNYPQCRHCAVQKYCSGIWKSAYELDSEILRPVEAFW